MMRVHLSEQLARDWRISLTMISDGIISDDSNSTFRFFIVHTA
jgi:hypothetical protein